MEATLVVGLGGAAGDILRWWIGMFMNHLLARAFWGTLLIILGGLFLVGVLLVWFHGKLSIGVVLPTGILVGFLGGFTTYWAFSIEAVNVMMAGFYGRAGAYVGGTVALCLMGAWGGVMLGRSV